VEEDKPNPVKRISILKVPVDIVSEEALEDTIHALIKMGGKHQIVLLSIWDLMRARRNAEYRAMINNASLIIPVSLSIVKAARFLKRELPVRFMPFEFIIKTLNALDHRNKTVYLLGSRKRHLQTSERNIRSTFRGLRIVGRYAGYYNRQAEGAVISAIQKAQPNLLLVGKGVNGRERWIYRNLKHFDSGLFLWCSNSFDVFAERAYRPSKGVFARGLEWIPYTLRRPWKIPRILTFFWFKILLIVYRLRKL